MAWLFTILKWSLITDLRLYLLLHLLVSFPERVRKVWQRHNLVFSASVKLSWDWMMKCNRALTRNFKFLTEWVLNGLLSLDLWSCRVKLPFLNLLRYNIKDFLIIFSLDLNIKSCLLEVSLKSFSSRGLLFRITKRL